MTRRIVLGSSLIALGCCFFVSLLVDEHPVIHDEFSYLLAAKTFANGKLHGEPHPHWQHFETLHVLQRPNYVSKYPPLQALILTPGLLIGRPVVAVWVSFAGASAALGWMLSLYGPKIAIFGVLAFITNGTLLVMWGNSYWGGAVTTFCAALMYGGLFRLLRSWSFSHASIFSLGVLGLAFCRPYEGFVAAALCFTAMTWTWFRLAPRDRSCALRVTPVFLLLVLSVLGLWAAYNKATTGSLTTMPYSRYQQEYSSVPVLLFLDSPKSKPSFRHREIRRFDREFQAPLYYEARSWRGYLTTSWKKIGGLFGIFVGLGYTILVLYWLRASWNTDDHFVLFALTGGFVALLIATYSQYHYFAPFLPLLIYVIGKGAAAFCESTRFAKVGLPLIFLAAIAEHSWKGHWHNIISKESNQLRLRPTLVDRLEALPGHDLVIVKYGDTHDLHEEWVYNGPDINAQSIVWARDMGLEHNRRLINYFEGRTVWLFEPDEDLKLTLYSQRTAGDQ